MSGKKEKKKLTKRRAIGKWVAFGGFVLLVLSLWMPFEKAVIDKDVLQSFSIMSGIKYAGQMDRYETSTIQGLMAFYAYGFLGFMILMSLSTLIVSSIARGPGMLVGAAINTFFCASASSTFKALSKSFPAGEVKGQIGFYMWILVILILIADGIYMIMAKKNENVPISENPMPGGQPAENHIPDDQNWV